MKKIATGPNPFLHPLPAVLVGALVDGRPNYMMAAWAGMVNSEPPMLSVSIRPARLTFAGVEANQAFSLNVPSTGLVAEADFCGYYSGRKKDKAALFTTFYGKLKTAPMIEECPLSLECRVVKTVDLPSHRLFIAEIVETYTSEDCLTDGRPDPVKMDPLTYSGAAKAYFGLGRRVGEAYEAWKVLKK